MITVDVLQYGMGLRTDRGTAAFCTVALISGTRRTLVDFGHVGRRNAVNQALRERGLAPGDIDVTVATHAHWDHIQNLDVFTTAPMLIHPHERKYAQAPHPNDWATPSWTGAMIETQPNVIEVDEGYEIEPGVTILHTPGHTAGSLCVMVETDNGLAAVTGDALHSGRTVLRNECSAVFWDERQAKESISRIAKLADVIYPGHDRPFRIVGDRTEYIESYNLEVSGIDPADPTISFVSSQRPQWVMPGISEQRLG